MIDHMPRDSVLREAQAQDDEIADEFLRREWMFSEDESSPSERFAEWSPVRAALADIDDRLQSLTRVIVMANGGKPGSFTPAPRPVSAVQRKRREGRVRSHRDLVARVLPGSGDGGAAGEVSE